MPLRLRRIPGGPSLNWHPLFMFFDWDFRRTLACGWRYFTKTGFMIASGFIIALLVATVITMFAAFVLKSRGPWGSAWTLFIFLLLALWTVSLWVRAMGPTYLGVSWLPIVFVGVLLMLLMLSIPLSGNTVNVNKPMGREGKLFWVLVVVFAIAIILGMINPQMAL